MLARTAEACPPPIGGNPALADRDPAVRLEFIRSSLNREARHAVLWTQLWIAGNGVLIAGTAGLIPFYPPENRVDLYVGMGATGVAALPLIFLPPSIERVGPAFDHRVSEATSLDPCVLIAEGEHLLARDAREAASVYTWFPQVTNVLYNVGVGLILGLGFHRWVTGISAMISGTTIGELVMLTEPKELSWDLARYMDGRLNDQPKGVAWALLPEPTGLSFRVQF